jgi:hypothetical protein
VRRYSHRLTRENPFQQVEKKRGSIDISLGLGAYVQSTTPEDLPTIDIAKRLVQSEKYVYAYIEAANKKAGSRSPWG